MVGKTISHYKVLKKIGQGGMGEVFLAQDTTLDRKVALKFLPEEMQQDTTARKRFLREAKSAAALDHPFICHIHEVGEVEGKSFISMEYVQGETLQDKLAAGSLPLKDALEKATEVAEALEEAHKKGIVHRDLKPSNIMLTPQGHVKVMDFGLAKTVTPAEGEEQEITTALTKQGSTLGTVPYMSPEQVRGQEVDTRSDIFSFGVVLYEMLTGVNPFKRDTSVDTSHAILGETPPPLTRYTEDIPVLLQHTVKKMLAKDADQRHQSIHEVRTNLSSLVSAPATPSQPAVGMGRHLPRVAGLTVVILLVVFGWLMLREGVPVVAPGEITSIAVLPLDNLMNDPEQEYFVDGMHEALITELSKIGALTVIARTSVLRYRDSDTPVREIARDLNVDAVIEGSVLRAGDTVRITAQLIDSRTEGHLWAESFDRELTDILALHSDVARAIAREIKVVVTPEEESHLAAARSVNPEAHELYLKGLYQWNKSSKEGFQKAIEYYEKAIAAEPNHAGAYALLSDSYGALAWLGYLPSKEACANLSPPLRKALEIDDTLADAHRVLGNVRFYCEWDWVGAEKEYLRAIGLNSSLAAARYFYTWYLYALGRFEKAIAEAKRALELDPLSVQATLSLGDAYYHARQYDQAIAQYQQTVEFEPNDPRAYGALALVYKQKGMHEEVVRAEQKAMNLSGASPEDLAALDRAYRESGPKGYRMWKLERLKRSHDPFPLSMAAIYAELGDVDQAFAWLEKAYQQRVMKLVFLNASPEWDPLRDDPRFQDLLGRMNFPE